MIKYRLFLDDYRFPDNVIIWEYSIYPWIIARSYNDAVYMVKTLGMPVAISFDHDLADAHYIGAESKEKTGYDFAKWLVDFHLDNNITPDFDYKVHSMNPVGAKNIQTLLDNFVRNE